MSLALRLLEGGPLLLERAATQTIVLEIASEASRERIPVTSATVTLYDPSRTALVSAAAMTPSTTTPGRATYSLAAASLPSTVALGAGYRLEYAVTAGGVSTTLERDVRVCRRVPACTVTAEDLYARHPDLRDQVPPAQVTTGVGWQPQIDSAWKEIQQRLDARGRRHELVWSVGSLHEAHLARTLELIYAAAITRVGDGARYERLRDDYRDAYRLAWDELVFEYDPDSDGIPNGTEAGSPMISAHAGPRGNSFAWGFGSRGMA